MLLLTIGLGPRGLHGLVLHVPHVELLQLLDVRVPGAAHLPLGQVGRGRARDKSTWVSLGLLVQIRGVARGQAILKQYVGSVLISYSVLSLDFSHSDSVVQHPDESLFVI